MNVAELNDLIESWQDLTNTVMDLKEIPDSKIQALLLQTYRVLIQYCSDACIPKEICKLFLEIESFLYFSSVMEKNEVGQDFYQFRRVDVTVQALKYGFFEGGYECNYPEIKLICSENTLVFNMESDNLKYIEL